MKGDTRAEGLDPLGEPGRTMDLASNPKGRGYPNIARLGGIDKTEGREEMSARRTPKWASRPSGKVSIPVVRKRVTRFERQLGAYNNVL